MSAQAPNAAIVKTLSAADIPHGHEIVGNLNGLNNASGNFKVMMAELRRTLVWDRAAVAFGYADLAALDKAGYLLYTRPADEADPESPVLFDLVRKPEPPAAL